MIARKMAALLWSKKSQIPVSPALTSELKHLHSLLANPQYRWGMQIGHVIPHDAQFTSFGDACLAGGALSATNSSTGSISTGRPLPELQLQPKSSIST